MKKESVLYRNRRELFAGRRGCLKVTRTGPWRAITRTRSIAGQLNPSSLRSIPAVVHTPSREKADSEASAPGELGFLFNSDELFELQHFSTRNLPSPPRTHKQTHTHPDTYSWIRPELKTHPLPNPGGGRKKITETRSSERGERLLHCRIQGWRSGKMSPRQG